MTKEKGRREHKKQLTRQALIDAAMRLFEQKGFDQTMVTEIAKTAGVSERTFYLHFPTKEDIVIGTAEERLEAGLQAITAWQPGETAAEVLERAAHSIVANTWDSDLQSGLATLRVRLLAQSPSVQARLLQRLLRTQGALIEAFHKEVPSLKRTEAAALVGSVIGALNAAAIAGIEQDYDPYEVHAALERAIAIAFRPETVSGTMKPEPEESLTVTVD